MMETDKTTNLGSAAIRHLLAQPGDGTRYELLIVGPLPAHVDCGELGSLSAGGFLVVCGLNQIAYLFWGEGFLDVNYVAEKLRLRQAEAEQVTRMLGAALSRPTEWGDL